MSKKKQLTETIHAALKSGDTTRPIIGRDSYAPKNGNGTAAKKTLTQLVKEAQEAADKAEKQAKKAEKETYDGCLSAARYSLLAEHAARAAKWCAAIAAASAIISIITAAI